MHPANEWMWLPPPQFKGTTILLREQHSNDMVRLVYMYKEVLMGFQNNKWFIPPPTPPPQFWDAAILLWEQHSNDMVRSVYM